MSLIWGMGGVLVGAVLVSGATDAVGLGLAVVGWSMRLLKGPEMGLRDSLMVWRWPPIIPFFPSPKICLICILGVLFEACCF